MEPTTQDRCKNTSLPIDSITKKTGVIKQLNIMDNITAYNPLPVMFVGFKLEILVNQLKTNFAIYNTQPLYGHVDESFPTIHHSSVLKHTLNNYPQIHWCICSSHRNRSKGDESPIPGEMTWTISRGSPMTQETYGFCFQGTSVLTCFNPYHTQMIILV